MGIEPLRLAWWYISHALFLGAGDHKADQMHLDIVEAVLGALDVDHANTVREQLVKRYFFSWMSDGRVNVFFFYDENGLKLIKDESFEDRLFKVELFVDGRRYVAQVGFYKGRIHRVELKKPRSFFRDKAYRVGAVTEGDPSKSYAAAIDRAEHGRETEINP